jgi:hypothetical protein
MAEVLDIFCILYVDNIKIFVINNILLSHQMSVFFQKQSENILQVYPPQQQLEQQHKRLSQQTFNTNTADQKYNVQPASPPNLDVVQSIEVHSYEEQMIAAPSQQMVEDNSGDETIIKPNITENTLNTNNDNEVKILKLEAFNEKETEIHKPQDEKKIFHSQAYELSNLSNGYKTKINSSFPTLETIRVPRSVDDHEELTENNSEQIQSGHNAESTNFPHLNDGHEITHTTLSSDSQEAGPINHAIHNKSVIKSVPMESKNIKIQVHEITDEKPNPREVGEKVSTNKNIRHDHRTKPEHILHKHMDPVRLDKKSGEKTIPPTHEAPSDISVSEHNDNGPSKDVITNLEHTSAFVQNGQNYTELDVSDDGHLKSRSIVSTHPSHKQDQDTSKHGPRRGYNAHGKRFNYFLLQNKSNEEKSIQENKQSDLESKINASHTLTEQTKNTKALQNNDYMAETHKLSLRLNEENEREQIKPLIISNENVRMPLSSMPLSDTTSSSPRSDPSPTHSITDTPERAELHVGVKTAYEETDGEEKNKDEKQESDYEELVTSSEQNDEKKSHKTLQIKSVMLDHNNSQNKERPQHNTEHEERMGTRDEEEDDGIYETISKILQKKDAISRAEEVVGRNYGQNKNKKEADSYRNFWVLEYFHPKFTK